MILQFEAKLAASALASAHWYASQERITKAEDNLRKAHLYLFAIKDPQVSERLRELVKATYQAWQQLDHGVTHFYY